jgi:hypothetical protein
VDRERANVVEGRVAIDGSLGSIHTVRIVSGKRELTQLVAITETGPLPDTVVVDTRQASSPRAPAPTSMAQTGRTATGGAAPSPSRPAPAGSGFTMQKSFE